MYEFWYCDFVFGLEFWLLWDYDLVVDFFVEVDGFFVDEIGVVDGGDCCWDDDWCLGVWLIG